jgi:hypothetical protein
MEQKLINLVEKDDKDNYFKAWEVSYEEVNNKMLIKI